MTNSATFGIRVYLCQPVLNAKITQLFLEIRY